MSTPPKRRDAARNRERLLDAAANAFREEGLGASVNVIAVSAGVNVATLYRHFPTKDDLVAAVLDTILEPVERARDQALAADAPVLAAFIHEAVREQRSHHGLVDALARDPATAPALSRLREPAVAIVEPIVERAHADGELRPDFGAEDVLVALRMIGATARPGLDVDRYIEVVLRGLRP
ncbi:TetR/AcrR family transcriptional regulator [Solirubrobacter phytolaccae]|uniref:TetR/AcrR family transcriptional regulator n=1 Tax=Solirubrobacter phytolaccae TaxID=1404360 RepID=A0A9X3SCK1_9ACTN|nr:TetR/AcrR family transcriptional regulator [Solirubrobacter phytolaccae]MDA0184791.1 TetR/AcrR family transcriptional regulator [Solirubrobacter phytolaccae]